MTDPPTDESFAEWYQQEAKEGFTYTLAETEATLDSARKAWDHKHAECLRLRGQVELLKDGRRSNTEALRMGTVKMQAMRHQLAAGDVLRRFMETLPNVSDEALNDPHSEASKRHLAALIDWFRRGDAVIAAYDAAMTEAKP